MTKKTSQLPTGIVNPFSPDFLQTWQLWKDYRWEEHKFKYKGLLSEQAKLMEIHSLSEGNEETAIAIIMQSITNTWKGFFHLKNKTNGSETHQRPTSNKRSGTSDARIEAARNW